MIKDIITTWKKDGIIKTNEYENLTTQFNYNKQIVEKAIEKINLTELNDCFNIPKNLLKHIDNPTKYEENSAPIIKFILAENKKIRTLYKNRQLNDVLINQLLIKESINLQKINRF